MSYLIPRTEGRISWYGPWGIGWAFFVVFESIFVILGGCGIIGTFSLLDDEELDAGVWMFIYYYKFVPHNKIYIVSREAEKSVQQS